MDYLGRDAVRECSGILEKKEASRCYIEANQGILSEKYSGKEVIALTSNGSSEIVAAYDPKSNNNWRQALSAIKETYTEEEYHGIVARELEKKELE